MSEETKLQRYKELLRKSFSKYTRQAFQVLPELDSPHILDVGCGSGIPTMELARLSNGQIVGLDIDQPLLDGLAQKIEEAGLSDRVMTLGCSVFDMNFPEESFDIIWAEGSISVIGFKKGLEEWRRFLKPKGFLVVHDEKGNVSEKLDQISNCGYNLLKLFTIHEDVWWTEYFAPLQKRINDIRIKCRDDPGTIRALDDDQKLIDMFQKNPSQYSSAFFIVQKK